MKAIIPVAGEGTRMRPYTYVRPKALLHVAGKPIIAHIIDKLVDYGIDEITVIVGHLGDKIREYVQTHYRLPVHFVEQKERLGIAHALYLAREFISPEPLFIVLGDTVFEADLGPVLQGVYTSVGIKAVEDPRRFGIVVLKDGFVCRLMEKPEQPETNLALVGMYYIQSPQLLLACIEELMARDQKVRGEYQLTDAFQMMIHRGHPISTFQVDQWFDCGKPEALLTTNRHLLDLHSRKCTVKGSIIHPPVFVEESAVITSSVIGPYVSVAARARIEHCLIRDSIIGERSSLETAMLDGSLIGDQSSVKGSFHTLTIGDMSIVEVH